MIKPATVKLKYFLRYIWHLSWITSVSLSFLSGAYLQFPHHSLSISTFLFLFCSPTPSYIGIVQGSIFNFLLWSHIIFPELLPHSRDLISQVCTSNYEIYTVSLRHSLELQAQIQRSTLNPPTSRSSTSHQNHPNPMTYSSFKFALPPYIS